MSKGQNSKKSSKKEPAKTMKEKKAAKREKKNEKMNPGILNQEHSWGLAKGSLKENKNPPYG